VTVLHQFGLPLVSPVFDIVNQSYRFRVRLFRQLDQSYLRTLKFIKMFHQQLSMNVCGQ